MAADAIVEDWKDGNMRVDADPDQPSSSPSSSKADEAEVSDQDRSGARKETSSGGRRFPRLGLDALLHESRPSGEADEDGTFHFYKVYKRRWFGLVELTLLNIVVSWDVSVF